MMVIGFSPERFYSLFVTASPPREFACEESERTNESSTVRVDSLPHRKWKETKQQPSMLPGPAVPGCRLVSFHILGRDFVTRR